MRSSYLAGAIGTAAAVAVAGACGGSDGDDSGNGQASGGRAAANSGGFGALITGGTSSSTGGSSASSGGPSKGDACAGEAYTGERIPLDMFIMQDKSGSMSGQNNQNGGRNIWIPVTGAIKAFVNSPQSVDIGVGLGYFPIGVPMCNQGGGDCDCTTIANDCSSCRLADYGTPDVPIQILPGAAGQIVQSLDAHGPSGATPTRPALEGALQYALAHAQANPDRKVVVVLATDGQPNDCSSNVNNVSQVAQRAFSGMPSVQTYVVGIGNTGNLNSIAQAGGTNAAIIVDSANAGQQFLDAMNQIRGAALTCEFTVPQPGPNQTVDPNEVNVYFFPQSGSGGGVIYKVDNQGACDPTTGGWYFDNNTNPTRVFLCDASCNTVKATPGRIELELHCPSVAPPPR
jgi:von Willebrand factor type A domain